MGKIVTRLARSGIRMERRGRKVHLCEGESGGGTGLKLYGAFETRIDVELESGGLMRAFISAVFACCALAAFIPLFAQDNAAPKNDPYSLCTTAMEKTPQEAYVPCKQYLETMPSDDQEHIKCVKQWITNYDKVLPYANFLQALPGDPKAAWFVFEPDTKIELPETNETDGQFKMQISRSFNGAYEEEMLKKAEAVYPRSSRSANEVFRNAEYWAEDTPKEMTPLWGGRGNDSIQQTSIVTASAVRYYYDLTMTERRNPRLASGFTAQQTHLKYDAAMKYIEKYSHKKDTFEDVYVADLTLEWGFNCGGLCGMGFTRNKVVVLDRSGNVIAMYLDAAVNSQSWVS